MGIDNMPLTMAVCLLFTIIIEVILAFTLGVRKKYDFLNVVLVNVATNPIVVTVPYLLFFVFDYEIYHYSIYVLEVLVFVFEGFIYSKVFEYKKINPFIVSFILNMSSYGIGLLLEGWL